MLNAKALDAKRRSVRPDKHQRVAVQLDAGQPRALRADGAPGSTEAVVDEIVDSLGEEPTDDGDAD